jgi:hypothetical protein
MHSSKCLDKQPRAHRLDLINPCALSDCCGAPIIQGGICFECRELCEEDDGVSRRPARFERRPITLEADLVVAKIEHPAIYFLEEDSPSAFDEMVLKMISA